MTLTKAAYAEAILNAKYIAALVARLPLDEIYDAQLWAIVFDQSPTREELVIVEALRKARRDLDTLPRREQQHPFSVEEADSPIHPLGEDGSGDASRIVFGQGCGL